MKKWFLLMAIAALSLVSCNENVNVIKTVVPERPAGQESVLGLRTEPIETVRIGIVGLGMRGASAVDRLTYVPDCAITAICMQSNSSDIIIDFFIFGLGILV